MKFDVRKRRRGRRQNDLYLSSVRPRSSFWMLLDNSFWVKPPAPFSKTRKGKERRDERQFVRSMNQPTAYIPPINWPPSAFPEHWGEGRYV